MKTENDFLSQVGYFLRILVNDSKKEYVDILLNRVTALQDDVFHQFGDGLLDRDVSDRLRSLRVAPLAVRDDLHLVGLEQDGAEKADVPALGHQVPDVHPLADHRYYLFKPQKPLRFFVETRDHFELDHLSVCKLFGMDFYLLSDSFAPLKSRVLVSVPGWSFVWGQDRLIDYLLIHDHVMMEEGYHATGNENDLHDPPVNGEKFYKVRENPVEPLGVPR